jgi:hypothetical protein
MYNTNYTFNSTLNPEAYITKGKNRLKQINDSVYLNDNDQFEIELFNPKTISVLAKIKINGNYLSNRGLILKPGQRIHLDRHIDEAKKFLFSTYEIDGENSAAIDAIQKNGLVEIEFYDETVLSGLSTVYPSLGGTYYHQPIFTQPNYNPSFTTITCSSGNIGTATYTSSLSSKSIETGRVEKGGKSDTELKNASGDYSYFMSHSVTWKLLPNSQKPVEVSELRNYCSGCGVRIKKANWKFCPTCGNEI